MMRMDLVGMVRPACGGIGAGRPSEAGKCCKCLWYRQFPHMYNLR